ncbi:MAG: hypothetical protein ACRDHP_09780 [Ktedonobacterales bacterium]
MRLRIPAVLSRSATKSPHTVRGRTLTSERESREAFADDLMRTLGVERATRRYLLYFVLPLWIGAGLADWRRHRRTHIEATAGTHESLIHSLMMTEIAIPILMGLFLELDALVLLVMIGTFFVHEATAYWDVSYAETLREVTPSEQHIHSFLEVLPFMTASGMLCLHWDQALALAGKGPERARLTLRPKLHKLSRRYVTGILSAVVAFVAVPYAEELWRCYRADHTLAAHPAAHPDVA